MVLPGILKNIGKMVIGSIIKDAGKHVIEKTIHHKKNNKKVINFNDVLNTKISDKKIKKSKLIDNLKKLKIEVLKKDIPADLKKKIIAKINILIKLLEKTDFKLNLNFANNKSELIKNEKENLKKIKYILKEVKILLEKASKLKKVKVQLLDDYDNTISNNLNNIANQINKLENFTKSKFSQKQNSVKKNVINPGLKHIVDKKSNNQFSTTEKIKKNNHIILGKENKLNKISNQSIQEVKINKKLEKILESKLEKVSSKDETPIIKNNHFLKDVNKIEFKVTEDKNSLNNILKEHLKKAINLKRVIENSNNSIEKVIKFENGKESKSNSNDNLKRDFNSNSDKLFTQLKSFNINKKFEIYSNKIEEPIFKQNTDFQKSIIQQIKQNLSLSNLKNEMTIKLNPPELGKLHIKLVMVNHELTAKITTENHIIKEVILNNHHYLNETLKEKGINLSNFQVNVQGEFDNNKESNHNHHFAKSKPFKNFVEFIENNDDFSEVWNLISEMENNLNLKV